MNKKIIILSGGFSEEKEVSKVSAREIDAELTANKYNTYLLDPAEFSSYCSLLEEIKKIDPYIVFIGLHGAEGENGHLQALFDLHKIPYTGSGCRASAVAMDKFLSSELASTLNVPVPGKLLISEMSDKLKDEVSELIGFPCVIKPNDSGSSVGISIISTVDEVPDAVREAFQFSKKVLCEQFIPGRELTVTILNDKPLPVVEIIPQQGWYDYNSKYTKGKTIYDVPAKLTKEETEKIQQYALNIFKLINCEVYARVDFRYDGSNFYFLEMNTLPGMTPLSLTPMAAREAGLQFGQLLDNIIQFSSI